MGDVDDGYEDIRRLYATDETMKLASPEEQLRLQRLVERVLSEQLRLEERGYSLAVTRIETPGVPPTRVRAWADLHFLPKGSPFCCMEPSCHLPPLDGVGDELRRRLKLSQEVSFELADVEPVLHTDVVLDGIGETPVPRNINEQDALGRTALWRAAIRDYEAQVEALLAAGADPLVRGPSGRTILDLNREGRVRGDCIPLLLERAAADRMR